MTKTIKPHFRMDNDFIDFNIMSNMTGDELKIYLYFFRRSNSCKDLCFCSFADVKLRTGIGTESAKIIVLSLSQKGFLAVIN